MGEVSNVTHVVKKQLVTITATQFLVQTYINATKVSVNKLKIVTCNYFSSVMLQERLRTQHENTTKLRLQQDFLGDIFTFYLRNKIVTLCKTFNSMT